MKGEDEETAGEEADAGATEDGDLGVFEKEELGEKASALEHIKSKKAGAAATDAEKDADDAVGEEDVEPEGTGPKNAKGAGLGKLATQSRGASDSAMAPVSDTSEVVRLVAVLLSTCLEDKSLTKRHSVSRSQESGVGGVYTPPVLGTALYCYCPALFCGAGAAGSGFAEPFIFWSSRASGVLLGIAFSSGSSLYWWRWAVCFELLLCCYRGCSLRVVAVLCCVIVV